MSEESVVVPGYVVSGRLGMGGMAEVYAARHPVTNRQVALKLMKSALSDSPAARKRFAREVQTLGALQHENIVGIIDAGLAEGDRPFLVMDHVEGKSIRDHLSTFGALEVHRASAIALQVARALAYAHAEGVTHRDVKPENVLLTKLADGSDRAVLVDFGIARPSGEEVGESKLTASGSWVGTPHYMSPEQARGELDIGPEADVHALGALLYEMLSGIPAHPGETSQAAIHHVLYHRPEPLPATIRASAPGLAALIEGCLEKVRDRRPTASEAIQVLRSSVRSRVGTFDSSMQTHPGPRERACGDAPPSKRWLGRIAVGATAMIMGIGIGRAYAPDPLGGRASSPAVPVKRVATARAADPREGNPTANDGRALAHAELTADSAAPVLASERKGSSQTKRGRSTGEKRGPSSVVQRRGANSLRGPIVSASGEAERVGLLPPSRPGAAPALRRAVSSPESAAVLAQPMLGNPYDH